MSRLIRKITLLTAVALVLVVGLAAALRWGYRAAMKNVEQAQDPAQPHEAAVRPAAPKPVHKSPMAEAFRSGHLPDPLPTPTGDPDQIAADLAKRIAAKDEQSTAALMRALQMAGFGIYSTEGQLVMNPSEPSQGMALRTLSVAATAKLFGDGWRLSLADLCVILGKMFPGFENVALGSVLTDGIVKASQGQQPLRFWARLIIELGKQGTPGYDLTSGKLDATNVQLDSIQVSLILERLYGDLASHSKTAQVKASRFLPFPDGRKAAPTFQAAVFHPANEFSFVRTAAQEGGSGAPCQMGEIGENILDANAILKTTEWEALVDIENQVGGGMTGKINAALAIIRFIYIYASMDVNITMEPRVLVRTYDTDPGKSAILTAKVTFDIQNAEMLNCLRPFLNREKIDFGNLPNGGPLEGVGVAWRLTEGGAPLPGQYHNDTEGLLEATHNAVVYIDNGGGKEGSTWEKETDKNGESKIKVTGSPQARDLTNAKRVPVMKEMALAVDVKFKNASTPDKLVGELLDVLGPGLGISSGDMIGGLTGAVTETMFRMHWNIDDVFTFPVQDWVATGAWTGTIRYVHTYEPDFPPNIIDNPREKSKATSTWRLRTESLVTLDGSMADDWSQFATLSGSSLQTRTSDSHTEVIDDCHSASNIVTYTEDSHSEMSEELTGKSSYRAIVQVIISKLSNGPLRYSVVTSLASGEDFTNNGTHKAQGLTTRSGCGESHSYPNGGPPQPMTIGLPIPGVEGELDPRHPDVIKGQTETSSRDGHKTALTWSLQRQ